MDTRDVAIRTVNGEKFVVGFVPEANELAGIPLDDLVNELERRIERAAKDAYQRGYEDHRNELQQFIEKDRKALF